MVVSSNHKESKIDTFSLAAVDATAEKNPGRCISGGQTVDGCEGANFIRFIQPTACCLMESRLK